MNIRFLIVAAIAANLTACGTGTDILGNISMGGDAVATSGYQDYSQSGQVTPAIADSMGTYARWQSPQAMRRLLGSPQQISYDGQTEIYQINGTEERAKDGTVVLVPRRLVVQYELSPRCQERCYEASNWYQSR
jgi:hypothetical protein